jgi:acetylornithine aminotransferase
MASFTLKKLELFTTLFTGRTRQPVATTDNLKIVAPMNAQQVVTLPLNDIDLEAELKGDVVRNYRTNSR